MSISLLLAASTAILKSTLENGLVQYGVTASIGGDVLVTALPPSRINTETEERAQINLFLYQTTPVGLYVAGGTASEISGSTSPQSLELNYVATTYGTQDLHCEILLGYVLDMFHTNVCIDAMQIKHSLDRVTSVEHGRVVSPALTALGQPELAQRFDAIRIHPLAMNPDKMLDLWSKIQAPLRPFQAYKVVVTLATQSS